MHPFVRFFRESHGWVLQANKLQNSLILYTPTMCIVLGWATLTQEITDVFAGLTSRGNKKTGNMWRT